MTTNERLPTKTIVINSHFHSARPGAAVTCDMTCDTGLLLLTDYQKNEVFLLMKCNRQCVE